MNRKRSERRFVFACLAPAVILMVLFIFIPTINVFRMSLYRMGGITNKQTFIGLENFKTLLGDKNFLQAMQNTILIIVLVMICTIILAVLFAALLNRGTFKGKNFFRVIFYIPNILSIVVIAGIFGAIYNPSTGLLNTFLKAIHLDGTSVDGRTEYCDLFCNLCADLAGDWILHGNVYGKYGSDSTGLL